MSYSAYGGLAAVGLIGVLAAGSAINRGMNYEPAKATIFMIDRECRFDRTYADGRKESVTQSCNSTDEFGKLSRAEKRAKDVDGKATVKVSYIAPQDGTAQTSALHFDGRDDEFYQLKAGDEIAILVSNDDLTKIMQD